MTIRLCDRDVYLVRDTGDVGPGFRNVELKMTRPLDPKHSRLRIAEVSSSDEGVLVRISSPQRSLGWFEGHRISSEERSPHSWVNSSVRGVSKPDWICQNCGITAFYNALNKLPVEEASLAQNFIGCEDFLTLSILHE